MLKRILFEVATPIGYTVRVTESYWARIVTDKHPVMNGRTEDVKKTLENPDQIRRSRSDPNVLLFYKKERPRRWICAVTKRLDGEGFLVTTYLTDAVKEGETIWTQ